MLPALCQPCPQSKASKGFALASGDLSKAKMAFLLESPGPDEPAFLVKDLVDGAEEMQRRRAAYPTLEDRFIKMGAPVVGRSGTVLWQWLAEPMGLHRVDVAIFNTLDCYPGKDEKGAFAYPKGAVRKKAEATCASLWLQPLLDWRPTVSVVGMHPAALSRDIVPLPVVLRAIEKAKVFAAKGERVLLLLGGKAAKHWLGYGENTTRWCGHWQRENDLTYQLRFRRWEEARKLTTEKKPKVKKLGAKDFLRMFHERYVGDNQFGPIKYCMPFPPVLSKEQYGQLSSLLAPKLKKTLEAA